MRSFRMLWRGVMCAAVLFMGASVLGADVQVGDSVDSVREQLGQPEGYIKSGVFELLVYPRGRVEVREGVVTKVGLVSAEVAEQLREQREQQRLVRLEAARVARQQRVLAGERERDDKLADVTFLMLPAGEQLTYWQTFRKRFPEVELDREYHAELTVRHRAELKEVEAEQRLRDMEQRVAAAEDRARRAEEQAEEARRERNRRPYYYDTYPTVRYRTPVIVTSPHTVYQRPRTPVRTAPKTIGPCTGRTYPSRAPYLYQPDYFQLRTDQRLQSSEQHGKTRIRASVSF